MFAVEVPLKLHRSFLGYLSSSNPYFGATIGRVANRIGNATFVVDDQRYNVTKNRDENSLHGGTHGWSMKVWNATVEDDRVVMTLVSPDDDQGYPGEVMAIVTFRLSDDGKLRIEMKATSAKATPINLTNHGYFNLAGHVRNRSSLVPRENSDILFFFFFYIQYPFCINMCKRLKQARKIIQMRKYSTNCFGIFLSPTRAKILVENLRKIRQISFR